MASKTSKLVPIDKGPVDVTPLGILQIAVQQGADVDKLAKLLELQERWQTNEARQAYNAAMAKFKRRPPQITKNKHVKFDDTEYDHPTLDHVVRLRDQNRENGRPGRIHFPSTAGLQRRQPGRTDWAGWRT